MLKFVIIHNIIEAENLWMKVLTCEYYCNSLSFCVCVLVASMDLSVVGGGGMGGCC